MKIDYISDLHIDFYLSPTTSMNDKKLNIFYTKMFEEGFEHGDVLVIAGDIGHYNSQNYEVLKFLKKYYQKVFFVLGNHDYYLVSNSIKNKYGFSDVRIAEMSDLVKDEPDIHLLDGDIIEYNGIKFGGLASWYDGSYTRKLAPMVDALKLWEHTMNDARLIHGYDSFYEIAGIERKKLEKIYKDVDVMITHVCPMPHAMFFDGKYKTDLTTGFYAFDGEYQVEFTPAKLWFWGHSHTVSDNEVYDTRLLCNALGYPNHRGDSMSFVKQVEI